MSADIRTATAKQPLFTHYEPGFRRAFAQGSLVRTSPGDPDHVRVGFWSSRVEGIEIEDNKDAKGTGYNLEFEAVMSWAALERLRALIELWQKDRTKLEQGVLEVAPTNKRADEVSGTTAS